MKSKVILEFFPDRHLSAVPLPTLHLLRCAVNPHAVAMSALSTQPFTLAHRRFVQVGHYKLELRGKHRLIINISNSTAPLSSLLLTGIYAATYGGIGD